MQCLAFTHSASFLTAEEAAEDGREGERERERRSAAGEIKSWMARV